MILLVEGTFRPRYNTDVYEFKLAKIHLLETVKPMLTKHVLLDIKPQHINNEIIGFIEKNIKEFPGNTSLRFSINDNRNNCKVGLYTIAKGFTMNDDMAVFLNNHPDVEVSVTTV
jgi:DNA polymerase-3 subunit alpha